MVSADADPATSTGLLRHAVRGGKFRVAIVGAGCDGDAPAPEEPAPEPEPPRRRVKRAIHNVSDDAPSESAATRRAQRDFETRSLTMDAMTAVTAMRSNPVDSDEARYARRTVIEFASTGPKAVRALVDAGCIEVVVAGLVQLATPHWERWPNSFQIVCALDASYRLLIAIVEERHSYAKRIVAAGGIDAIANADRAVSPGRRVDPPSDCAISLLGLLPSISVSRKLNAPFHECTIWVERDGVRVPLFPSAVPAPAEAKPAAAAAVTGDS
jgi:hypothetical protein